MASTLYLKHFRCDSHVDITIFVSKNCLIFTVLVGLLNSMYVRYVTRVQTTLAIAKFLALVLITVIGFWKIITGEYVLYIYIFIYVNYRNHQIDISKYISGDIYFLAHFIVSRHDNYQPVTTHRDTRILNAMIQIEIHCTFVNFECQYCLGLKLKSRSYWAKKGTLSFIHMPANSLWEVTVYVTGRRYTWVEINCSWCNKGREW